MYVVYETEMSHDTNLYIYMDAIHERAQDNRKVNAF